MRLSKYIALATFIFTGAVFFAQEQLSAPVADVSIRFYNKTIYYPETVRENPILIRITIANKTPNTMRFKLADDRTFSMDFTAVTSRNIQLAHTDSFVRKHSRNEPVFFREIALEPGEEYSFTENLKDYIQFEKPGMYIVEGYFYPELNRLDPPAGERIISKNTPSVIPVTANKLTVEIRPAPSAASVRSLSVSAKTHDILKRIALPPDQIVEQTIIARQKDNWDEFFLYMDLEEMINRDASRKRKFENESADGHNRMIENYKNDLRMAAANRDITTVPESFTIERTSYTPTNGEVITIQSFAEQTYRSIKRYTYKLHQKDGIWLIYDYEVDNLKKE